MEKGWDRLQDDKDLGELQGERKGSRWKRAGKYYKDKGRDRMTSRFRRVETYRIQGNGEGLRRSTRKWIWVRKDYNKVYMGRKEGN